MYIFFDIKDLIFVAIECVDVRAQSHRHKSFYRFLCNGVFNGKERYVG